jgi:OmcA/MtrC family decaheme c-type cytochrome
VRIVDAGISDAGVTTVEVQITDAMGRALDRSGLTTEGEISVSFVLGWVRLRSDGQPMQYQSYTTRNVTFDGGTYVQNGVDSNGSWATLELGRYQYRFGTVANVGSNTDKTHTVGLYATRTFQGQRYVSNAVFHFRPDAQTPTAVRDVVSQAACDTCHTRLEAHGGARRDVRLCVMCHTDTNAIDRETGNTIDFKVMVHKIHRGAQLPSVSDAGVRYQFVGFGNQTVDFSTVEYPANLADCDLCHTGSQGSRWGSSPSTATCVSCHDRTWLDSSAPPATYVAHYAGPRDDTQCALCHSLTGVAPADRLHPAARRDPNLLTVTSSIVAVPRGAPLQVPSVTFAVAVNGQPRDVLSNRLSRLRFVYGGPNVDIARSWSETAENAADCASVIDGGPCLARVDAGVFTWRGAAALLATDQGSFTVGIEACASVDAGFPAGVRRYCATNPVAPFAVTDAQAIARRMPVTLAQCNTCHQVLAAHGGTRTNPEHCVICHNANLTLAAVVPGDGGVVTAEGANFKQFIHARHASTPYPSQLNDCAKCHTSTGYLLPLSDGQLPTREDLVNCGQMPDGGSAIASDGTCQRAAVTVNQSIYVEPQTSLCIACHASVAAQAHASLNTTSTGVETCAVCHAAGRSAGVDSVHALGP